MQDTNYTPITQIPATELPRITTGISKLDKFLGGGFVPSQTIMLAGEPGAGKSTFLLQTATLLAQQRKVLYVSGEEALTEVRLRADRTHALSENLLLTPEIALEEIIAVATETKPEVLIVDSLQMIYSNTLRQAPASPTQMRYCLNTLIRFCKANHILLITIGHSTKSGLIAGLLTLQHMVDAVLIMERGEYNLRKLLSSKNRFGPAPAGYELTMDKTGFKELRGSLWNNIFSSSSGSSSSSSSAIQPIFAGEKLPGTNNYYFRMEQKNWAGIVMPIVQGVLYLFMGLCVVTFLLPFYIIKGFLAPRS